MSEKMTGYPSIDKPWMKYYKNVSLDTKIPEMSLYQYAFECNKDTLNNIALNYFGKNISYKKFFDTARMLANGFVNLGIREGDFVTILSMSTPETVASMYGLNYIGAIANMVYFTSSGKEVVDSINNTDSKAFLILDIALEKIYPVLDQIDIPIIVLSLSDSMPFYLKVPYSIKLKHDKKNSRFIWYSQFIKNCSTDENDIFVNNASLVAVVVYTSGSTGEPKGVMLTNENIISMVYQYKLTDFRFGKGETFLNFIPPFVGYGIGMMSIALCNGLKNYILLDIDVKKVEKMFWKVKPNHIEIPKGHALQILSECNKDANLEFIVNFAGGGTELSIEEEKMINDLLHSYKCRARYAFGYGLTECASAVCTNSNGVYKDGSIGIPLPLSIIKIVDVDTKTELGYYSEGEIYISSPNLMKGYYNNQAATDAAIEVDDEGTRWLRTGDLGYMDEDGFVFFKGRIKRIYTVAGADKFIYKLFPQRIEELFISVDDVEKCAVAVIEDTERLHAAYAFVKGKGEKNELIIKLQEIAMKELPEHLQPKKIVIVEDIPINATGKYDYKTLELMANDVQ